MTVETEMSIIRAIQQYLELAGYLAIEAKRPREKLTILQEAFLQSVRETGGVAGVAHSVEEAIEPIGLH